MNHNSEHQCMQPDRSQYEELRPQVTRRNLLKMLGIGLAAFGLSSQSELAFAASTKIKAGKTSEVAVKGAKGYSLKGKHIIVTQPKKGIFKAFSGICTHAGASIDSINGTNLVCRAHGSSFNTTTGKVTNGPASQGLQKYTVSINRGYIYVTL